MFAELRVLKAQKVMLPDAVDDGALVLQGVFD